MSATVKTRELVRNSQVDDMHYDASEEESICGMNKTNLENALPILDAPQSQQCSVIETTCKTWPGKRILRPRPVMTGSLTSGDEDNESSGSAARRKHKTIAVKRHALWPRLPLTLKAHDSGAQGLDDSVTDSVIAGGEMRIKSMGRKHAPDVLNSTQVEGESEGGGKTFRGIADQDSSEERWRKIVLEEHVDKILKAVPNISSDERETVDMGQVMKTSIDTNSEYLGESPSTCNWKEGLVRIVRVFASGRRGGSGV